MTTEHPTPTITLTTAELEHLTGYKQPTQQLNVLHSRGFHRAFMSRTGVVLERAHYDAVCRGQLGNNQPQPLRTVNLSFMQQHNNRRRAA
jgi:hypothetical protein